MLKLTAINEMLDSMDVLLKKILNSDKPFYDRLELKELYQKKYKNTRKANVICMALIWAIINEK